MKSKTYVPSLTKLRVVHNSLRLVTDDSTREETRHNCAKVAQVECSVDLFIEIKTKRILLFCTATFSTRYCGSNLF